MYPLDNQNSINQYAGSSVGSNSSSEIAPTDAAGKAISPHIVIRGESNSNLQVIHESPLALIDWLSFTLHYDNLHTTLSYIEIFLRNLFGLSPAEWTKTNTGWHGYQHKIQLGKIGYLAYGGNSQKDTIHVSISGSGCKNVESWEIISLIGNEENWSIKRVDLAHDDFKAKYVDIDRALNWFEEGLFTTSGRPPKRRLIDDFDSGEGRTFYVGNRANGKLLRIYEKGKQLGDKNSPWVRAELELRAKDRIIPWDVLTSPEQYLSGSYKALSFLSETQSRLKTTQREVTTNYESMKRWLRMAGGKALNTMLEVEQGDISAVFEQIVRDGYPSRLADLKDYLPNAVVKDL